MSTEKYKRRLTAIFSADVAGYSRLMGEDEAATVSTITNYREIIAELIEQHRGRIVDSPGDNVLAEFASVVQKVRNSSRNLHHCHSHGPGNLELLSWWSLNQACHRWEGLDCRFTVYEFER
jgi:class 3 adenylate cyclase